MINATFINYIVDPKQFPMFLAGSVAAAITALFYQFIQPAPSIPSGATIANIHQDGNYGDRKNQTVFNEWFADTIKKTIAKFDQRGQTVESILRFIGRERRTIAIKLDHNNADLYGRPRPPNLPMHTHITLENRYAAYREKCMDLYNKKQVVFQGRIEGEATPISLSGVGFVDSTEIAVIHATFTLNDYYKIINYLQKKTEEVFYNKSIPKKELIRLLGTMHWWLAQTMLFQRGSACISEVFIQAIASANGFPSTQWKPNTMPDLEAILSEHDDFVNRYEELLLLN